MAKSILTIGAMVAALGLAGCGAAPSEADVRAAMTRQIEEIGGKAGADMFKDEVAKMKLINCAKADVGGYRCDWTGGISGSGSGRFVKSDSGWVLMAAGG